MGERRQAFAVRCIRSIYIIFAEGLGKVKENSSHKKSATRKIPSRRFVCRKPIRKSTIFQTLTQFPANQIPPSAPNFMRILAVVALFMFDRYAKCLVIWLRNVKYIRPRNFQTGSCRQPQCAKSPKCAIGSSSRRENSIFGKGKIHRNSSLLEFLLSRRTRE